MIENDSSQSFEMRGYAWEIAHYARDSMVATYLGTRLSFDPHYMLPNEYEAPPPIQVC